jgi:hypothetical protein
MVHLTIPNILYDATPGLLVGSELSLNRKVSKLEMEMRGKPLYESQLCESHQLLSSWSSTNLTG